MNMQKGSPEHILVRANFYQGWITTGYDPVFRDSAEILAAIEMLQAACNMGHRQYRKALELAKYIRDKTKHAP